MVKVDLRTITLNIPPQEVITKDNVPVRVNAVAYFRIVAPKDAIVQVENFMVATSQNAQTTLRSVLGQHVLDELLSEREKINAILQTIIDEATGPWGIKVSAVEVKDVEIPAGMQRAMARQAEAERERRAKVINAEGEFQASERLKDAALVIEDHPIALQLRYLQTLLELGGVAGDDDRLPGPDRPVPAVPRGLRPQARLWIFGLTRSRVGSSVVAPNRRRRPGASAGLIEDADRGGARGVPVLRGARGADAARDVPGRRCSRLDGARRPEPLPRLRAARGGRALAAARAHVRRAERRRGRRGRGGVASARGRLRSTRASRTCTRSINEGAAAGSSLPHSHSQLVWLREPPPEVARETGAAAELAAASSWSRSAARCARRVHRAGRLPYETADRR